MTPPFIMVVDDDPHSLFGICQILTDEGFQVVPAQNGKEALEKLKTEAIDILVTDEKMPDMSGMELLCETKKIDGQVPVIFITAYGSVSMAVEALKQGAFYFFEKPIFNNLERFLTIIQQALKTREMERELDQLRKEVSEKYSFPNIIGNHPKMMEIFEIIGRVAGTDKTVLIQGESGTGKDLIARTIHYHSRRKDKPFVTVPCGALTDTLLTSELFGHTKGAFTGAVKETTGRFQAADGGTLVLDEIGEAPLNLQKTLLRVIEEKEFERVGDSRPIKVDIRILATTNRNLQEEMRKGNFRQDLYYRLSIVSLMIPPLRERVSDIPLLVKHFFTKFKEGKDPGRIKPEVLEYMKRYPWHGNVRELSSVIQQMILFCNGGAVTVDDLPPHFRFKSEDVQEGTGEEIQLPKMVQDLEGRMILKRLKDCNWNQEKTAKLLGITRKMLTNRIKKYRLDKFKEKLV
jgi:two-component system NtrC family response regulator